MKVLHLTTHLNIGGITTYILKLVRPLRQHGIEIQVLSSGGECLELFRKEGAKTFELPIRTKSELNPKIFFALPKVVEIIRRERIDLIHAHTRITQVMAFFLERLTGVPAITTCHGFYKRRLGRRLLPAWGRKAIAISQNVAEHLSRDFKVPESRIVTIHNGGDLESLDEAYRLHDPSKSKESYGFQKNDYVVGIVARLVEDKGHEYLLRALAVLPDARLLIVGDGRYRGTLEGLARSLRLENRVVFTGNITDVPQPLSAMDIFALPATWREGFGLSIAEAMACRKAVIVSNIWALNTLIKHKDTGILIEPRQIEPLVEALKNLFLNPLERKELGERARNTVAKHFTVRRMAEAIARLYSEQSGKILTPV